MVDRFHLAQKLSFALSQARRAIQRVAPPDVKAALKGPFWLLVKNRENRTAWLERAQASGLQAWRTFVKTVQNRQDSVLNYFDGRHSSGFAEGVNPKIKLLNRRAFGYRNFNSFRLHARSVAVFGP